MTVTLKGMTWNHPRGLDPLLACSREYSGRHPGTMVEWDARSLQDFADFPLEELVNRYDLLVFDHPFVGEVASSGLLLPIDSAVPREFLDGQRNNSVGQSHLSYDYGGHQWALAVDAACHVSVSRPDLASDEGPPQNWDSVVAEARRRASAGLPRMGMPLLAIDSLLSFVTILANRGHELLTVDGVISSPSDAEESLELVAELHSLAHPASISWNPIQMLDVMATSDEIAFSPITFGYVNYSTEGFRPRRLSFGPIPGGSRGIGGGVLGGAGLGISARSAHIREAISFATYAASGSVQASVYVGFGGQPGHRSAWTDERVDQAHGGFFSGTLPGIDASYLRPRWPGYLPAQTAAAELVHAWLIERDRSASQLVRELDAIFSQALFDSAQREAS